MASLAELKAERFAVFQLFQAVDPFCDGIDAKLAAAGEHASHERVFARGLSELVDQSTVHLYEIHRQPMQILQRGRARAEIVDAHAVSHSA